MADHLLIALSEMVGSLPVVGGAVVVIAGLAVVLATRMRSAATPVSGDDEQGGDADSSGRRAASPGEANNNIQTQTAVPVQQRTTQTQASVTKTSTRRTQTTCERAERRTQTPPLEEVLPTPAASPSQMPTPAASPSQMPTPAASPSEVPTPVAAAVPTPVAVPLLTAVQDDQQVRGPAEKQAEKRAVVLSDSGVQTDKQEPIILPMIIRVPDAPITAAADVGGGQVSPQLESDEPLLQSAASRPQLSSSASRDLGQPAERSPPAAAAAAPSGNANSTQTQVRELEESSTQTALGYVPDARGHSAVTQTNDGYVVTRHLVSLTGQQDDDDDERDDTTEIEEGSPPLPRAAQAPMQGSQPRAPPRAADAVQADEVATASSSSSAQPPYEHAVTRERGTDAIAAPAMRSVSVGADAEEESSVPDEADSRRDMKPAATAADTAADVADKSTQWQPICLPINASTQCRAKRQGVVRNKATQWDPYFNRFSQTDFGVQVTPRSASRGVQFSPLMRNAGTMTVWPPPKPRSKKKKKPAIEQAAEQKEEQHVQQASPSGQEQAQPVSPGIEPGAADQQQQQQQQQEAESQASDREHWDEQPPEKYYEHVPDAPPSQLPYYGPYRESPAPEQPCRPVDASERSTPFTMMQDLTSPVGEASRPDWATHDGGQPRSSDSSTAFVTLVTNDAYGVGALVLGHSLRFTQSRQRVVLVTDGVSGEMRRLLNEVYDDVREVSLMDSKDEEKLAMMKRPELGVTLTKLRAWNVLDDFRRCVFLDADTMVLMNIEELFEETAELSAAPDYGWPDLFNTGMFVFSPSKETYGKLLQMATTDGSFDGGDQGLLNQYFKNWNRLSCLYNAQPSTIYTYGPAYDRFGGNIKIVHFLGAWKPWMIGIDPETRRVTGMPPYDNPQIRTWLALFQDRVLPKLSSSVIRKLAPGYVDVGEENEPSRDSEKDLEQQQQRWELGNPDYTGEDSFENILAHLHLTTDCTLATPRPRPKKVQRVMVRPKFHGVDGSSTVPYTEEGTWHNAPLPRLEADIDKVAPHNGSESGSSESASGTDTEDDDEAQDFESWMNERHSARPVAVGRIASKPSPCRMCKHVETAPREQPQVASTGRSAAVSQGARAAAAKGSEEKRKSKKKIDGAGTCDRNRNNNNSNSGNVSRTRFAGERQCYASTSSRSNVQQSVASFVTPRTHAILTEEETTRMESWESGAPDIGGVDKFDSILTHVLSKVNGDKKQNEGGSRRKEKRAGRKHRKKTL
ncbi:PREDICTED: uncharacterized protein LOC106819151 isoform X2 [Priapulus caudatus]|uniref:glycogenin glucosyltransferase n=1 Tax=Priapulus caudatus TaxID=37621 RepID=A0ABM1F4L3_PRICU|nr:PREDICTED: uncharacterized protein LOC106819151 isoform X2 [Priapulus caudatus]